MKLSENIINRIISLSSQIDVENRRCFPSNTAVSLSSITAEDLLATPMELELMELIGSLSLEEKAELEAIYWLGRGDFDDFQEAKANAFDQDPSHAETYLTEKIDLGGAIRDGLQKL